MWIWTVEIAGRAVMAFPAATRAAAVAEMDDNESTIRDGLFVCAVDRLPLWDGKSEIHVRVAEQEEFERWDRTVSQAIRDGAVFDRDEALQDQYVVYLIPLAESE